MYIVTPGHYASAVGATYKNDCGQLLFSEYPETKTWARKLYHAMGDVAVYVGAQSLRRKVEAINELCKLNDVKLAIEMHFNSAVNADGNHVGCGSETLFHPGSTKGKEYAEVVQAVVGKHFPPDRGVKEGYHQRRKTNGPLYFLSRTACPAIIVEPQFVQFHDEIESKRDECCHEIAQVLMEIAD